ncbi:fumarylacetoacetate hydrolase family protein [Streptosporangium sp. NPDC001682]
MKLARIGPPGAERPALCRDGRYYDLSSVTDDRFFTPDRLERIRAATDLPEIDMTGQRIAAPVPRPGVVLCVGQNYAAHAAESGSEPPEHPVMFYKAPGTVIGPNDQVLIPRRSAKTDWEVELAVVIGTTARYLASPEDAVAHIAGYCLSNDVSERDFQLAVSGGQWSKGKSCETFQPLGPWLVTADEIADVQDLRLRSWVHGSGSRRAASPAA